MATREQIADRITELLIEHFDNFQRHEIGGQPIDIPYFQHVIRQGVIQQAGIVRRTEDEKLVLYRSDVKATEDDIELLDFISETYPNVGLQSIGLSIRTSDDVIIGPQGEGYHYFINLIVDGDIISFSTDFINIFFQDNLSQFINFEQTYAPIDLDKATQILDTNIFELIPPTLTRQQRINRFFTEYNKLKPPSAKMESNDGAIAPPLLDIYGDDGLTDTIDPDAAEIYSDAYDISDAPVEDVENRYITWLKDNEDDNNTGKSLESLRNTLNANYFLQQEPEFGLEDGRPEYEPRSAGYLKIRGLNQAVIIRNEESSDIGLIGQNPLNPVWQTDGFTITMWVKFLDKVNSGTLFNFGNPLRLNDPTGFALETFIVEQESYANTNNGTTYFGDDSDFASNGFFISGDVERFVRLIVRDEAAEVRDSHVGNVWMDRIDTTTFATKDDLDHFDSGVSPFNYVRIPIDFSEWYYIVATYKPWVVETIDSNFINDPDYWRWNKTAGDVFISNSDLGARCKVEIISRTDLMRARGFQP